MNIKARADVRADEWNFENNELERLLIGNSHCGNMESFQRGQKGCPIMLCDHDFAGTQGKRKFTFEHSLCSKLLNVMLQG